MKPFKLTLLLALGFLSTAGAVTKTQLVLSEQEKAQVNELALKYTGLKCHEGYAKVAYPTVTTPAGMDVFFKSQFGAKMKQSLEENNGLLKVGELPGGNWAFASSTDLDVNAFAYFKMENGRMIERGCDVAI